MEIDTALRILRVIDNPTITLEDGDYAWLCQTVETIGPTLVGVGAGILLEHLKRVATDSEVPASDGKSEEAVPEPEEATEPQQ